jgi:glucokinase
MTDVGEARHAPPCLALDIGATKVEAALVERDGTTRARSCISDADHHDHLITAIIELSRRVMSEGPVAVVGVGCAGPMSGGGEEVSPLNIPQWRAFPLRRTLSEALGLDVFVDGDARALALADGAFGAALVACRGRP